MLKRAIITIATALLVCSAAFSQDDTTIQHEKKWTISCSGYFQVMASTLRRSFEMPFAKMFIHGQRNERLSFHVELRPTSGNPIVKAYLEYSFCPTFSVLLGQLSNPFKRIEPQPEDKEFVYYALYPHYVANGDDIGIAAYGQYRTFTYYGCFINGTGRNTSDNNSAKDVSGHISFQPTSYLTIETCGQTGKQPNGVRTAWFTRCSLLPLPNLQLQTAVIRRTDLDDWGWYLVVNYDFRLLKLSGRVHSTTQNERPQYTAGITLGEKPLKLQLNAVLGKNRLLELATSIQIFIE